MLDEDDEDVSRSWRPILWTRTSTMTRGVCGPSGTERMTDD